MTIARAVAAPLSEVRRHGQARNIQPGPADRAGRGLCRGRDRASAMAWAVPQHHARLGAAAGAGHRRDRRRRDPRGHGPGGDSTVAPRFNCRALRDCDESVVNIASNSCTFESSSGL